ncbi:DUF397 domain-containing protein [Streptomyces buecherae]|uniref:DUF397 domain-containing protein n=1 Tax=Streptomyces buecherae TaxID=2763006 RepID=UPI0037B911A8
MTQQGGATAGSQGSVPLNGGPSRGWTKSSYSNHNGACVEIHVDSDVVAFRDSKDPDGPVLRFHRGEAAVFIAAVADGSL